MKLMTKLKNYLLFFWLLENIAVQTSLFGAFSSYFFYTFLVFGAIFLIFGDIWKRDVIAIYWPLYALSFVYLLYEFTLGYNTINSRSLLYLAAKFTTFAIIINSVENNYYFYESKLFKGLACFMIFFILYSFMTGGGADASVGRAKIGFTNTNTTSGMGAFILASVLFSYERWNLKNIILAGIGLFAVLAGGSRAGILVSLIIIFMRYGITPKMFLILITVVTTAAFIFPLIGLETVGVERFLDTINGVEGTNRDAEREACWMMIHERPWTGWGFEAQNQGAALAVSALGSHNGYFETLKFMGIPFGGLWIGIYLLSVFIIIVKYYRNGIERDIFLALLVAFSVNAYFEGLFIGIHEFSTNIIFFCIAMAYKKCSIYRMYN